jgi:hypothetical protein
MRLALLAFCLIAGSAASAQESERWLCVAELSTGFTFNKSDKSWQTTKFTVHNDKFIVHRPTSDTPISRGMKWVVTRVGERMPNSFCANDFAGPLLTCSSMTTFKFSKEKLRFSATYDFGFVEPDTEGNDTPSMTIGKCSPI